MPEGGNYITHTFLEPNVPEGGHYTFQNFFGTKMCQRDVIILFRIFSESKLARGR